MAFLGHFIFKQQKCWSNLSVSLANVSIQRFSRRFSTETTETSNEDDLLFQEASITQESRVRDTEPRTFEELFKKSAFVSLGNPKGKIVIGTIRKVVEDSLYIDFGWKFPCVCPRPSEGRGSFYCGRKVRILIKELELATKFLGSKVEITLNEADCVLLGLHSPDIIRETQKSDPRESQHQTSRNSQPLSGERTQSIPDLLSDDSSFHIDPERVK